MISSLKRQFVVTASVILFVFTFVLISAINGFNLYTTTKYVDGIIDMINTNDGGKPLDLPQGDMQGGFMRPISKQSLANTKFFTVRINAKGEIVDVNVSNVDYVTQEQARAYAEKVLAKSKKSGYVDDYRYKLADAKPLKEKPQPPEEDKKTEMAEAYLPEGETPFAEGDKILTFFDWYEQKNSFLSGLVLSYLIGAVGFAIVVILLSVFSRKAVDPISESIGAQREFITNVSHEIKTPLTVISGDVDILKMSGVDSEWLDNIQEQVRKSKSLVDDLVLLSKMNEENIVLSFEKFDLSAFVDDSLSAFYSVAETRDLTISSNIKPEIIVNANSKAISELISILIENALKYCDKNGRIEISLECKGKAAELSVSNSYAEPIGEENLKKMFDRYFRTRKARDNSDGSGIGLSIAKAITVAHRGKINATQTDGAVVITASMNVLDKTKEEDTDNT